MPLSLVCKAPQMIPSGSDCSLLVSDDWNSNIPAPPTTDSSAAPPPPPSYLESQEVERSASQEPEDDSAGDDSAESEDADDDEEEAVSEDPTSRVMHEILKFIASLRSKGILSQNQAILLEDILFTSSTLLFAAYSVAVSASDVEYFAQICCGIAISLETEDGRDTCEAQDEVLNACDRLFLGQKITENQLLYLRHLVLTRDDTIGNIYDQFGESQSSSDMIKALYMLANNHPRPAGAEEEETEEEEEEGKEEEEEEEDDEEDDSDYRDEIRGKEAFHASSTTSNTESCASDVHMGSILQTVVQLMFKKQHISKAEARALLEMIADNDEYCIAAYEVWHQDQNVEELCDTLKRCAKLELRKRAASDQQAAIEERIAENPSSYPNYGEEEGEGEADSDASDDTEASTDDDEESESDVDADGSQSAAEVAKILQSNGLRNIWKDTVPERFVNIVFVAANRKLITIPQGKALCDLFQAQYDLVRAAWEVYCVEKDARDFIDTLKRIVRDLQFDDRGNVEFLTATTEANDNQVSEEEYKPAASVTIANAVQKADSAESKRAALGAVLSAKSDLLAHSLELMVKQELTTTEGAASVLERYQNGDSLVDAAIDQYATDRNVAEFLDTLQVLASFTPEQIEDLMRDAAAKEEQGKAAPPSFEDESGAEEVVEEDSEANAVEESESDGDDDTDGDTESESDDAAEEKPTSNNDEESDDEIFPFKALIELTKKQLLTIDMYNVLKSLVQSKHPHVMAVFDVYKQMRDTEDLVDSLIRVTIHFFAIIPLLLLLGHHLHQPCFCHSHCAYPQHHSSHHLHHPRTHLMPSLAASQTR